MSRCNRRARRSVVNTSRPFDSAGYVALPRPVTRCAADQPAEPSVDVQMLQRQSVDRESYHAARTTPFGSVASTGCSLIASLSAPMGDAGDHDVPPSVDVAARIARFTPAACSGLLSHAA